jgi:hypothetical protein
MKPGDIVEIFAPIAGYRKYHLCLILNTSGTAHEFLFLNSDPGFRDCFVVDDREVPCLPPSPTGKTAFSFSMVPRYTAAQLSRYRATVLGHIDRDVAERLRAFAPTVRSLPAPQLAAVISALDQILATPQLPP